jgi:hypothetical protein
VIQQLALRADGATAPEFDWPYLDPTGAVFKLARTTRTPPRGYGSAPVGVSMTARAVSQGQALLRDGAVTTPPADVLDRMLPVDGQGDFGSSPPE